MNISSIHLQQTCREFPNCLVLYVENCGCAEIVGIWEGGAFNHVVFSVEYGSSG